MISTLLKLNKEKRKFVQYNLFDEDRIQLTYGDDEFSEAEDLARDNVDVDRYFEEK